MPSVYVRQADNRERLIADIAETVKEELRDRLKGKKQILLKPNLVKETNQLAVTHVDSMRAILRMVREVSDIPIIVGDACFQNTMRAMRNFGYLELVSKFKSVRLEDFNKSETVGVHVYGPGLNPTMMRLARTVVESDFRISVAPVKTHDLLTVTLGIKNVVMGSLVAKSFLGLIHSRHLIHSQEDYPRGNINLAGLARLIPAHLTILDGYEAMEGEGPVHGDKVEWRTALAGFDPVATDSVCAQAMGFELADIGYLHLANKLGVGENDISVIDIDGPGLAKISHQFRPHPNYEEQKEWQFENEEKALEQAKEDIRIVG